tara:strand:- start:428 stop:604 length:177 start_codon:yes stop_codon:yes gene_type:complete
MASVQVVMEENYCIVSAFDEDANDLAEKVQHLLTDGWSISGGIASLNSKLYQTLTRNL